MKNRCFAALMMVAVLLCMACPFVSAASFNDEANTPATRWANTSSVSVDITFSGNTATYSGNVTGYTGTTQIVAIFLLERKESNGSYTEIKRWPAQTTNSATLRFADTYSPITSGNTYRFSVSATVTRNGTSETVNNWVEKKA